MIAVIAQLESFQVSFDLEPYWYTVLVPTALADKVPAVLAELNEIVSDDLPGVLYTLLVYVSYEPSSLKV